MRNDGIMILISVLGILVPLVTLVHESTLTTCDFLLLFNQTKKEEKNFNLTSCTELVDTSAENFYSRVTFLWIHATFCARLTR